MDFYSSKIESYSFPIENIIKIDFKIPYEIRESFLFNPGQYIVLSINIDGTEYFRSYSITSLKNDIISIHIKKVLLGKVTSYLFNKISEIDYIKISKPIGDFYISTKPNEKRTIVFFATGVGITPIYNQINYLLDQEKGVNIFLFYGNKNKNNTLFFDEINDLKIKYPNFSVYFLYSEEPTNQLFQGRLNDKKLDLFINQILEWDEVDHVLISGQPDMIKNLAQGCFERGIPIKNIHYEFFNLENNFSIIDSENKFKSVNVDFSFNGKQKTFIWNPDDKTLLQSMLDLGETIPYSCKSGVCGICQCTLIDGELELKDNLVLTESELEDGLRLSCVAIPRSEKIKISI